jgi:ectoine hydroxylase-related dioxygenase (phytanoyl-CoA dioxygenase family)
MERHLRELELYGFTLVRDALPQPLLGTIQAAFDAAVQRRQGTDRATQFGEGERTGRGGVDFARAYEEDPAFLPLLDLQPAFGIAKVAMSQGRGGLPGTIRMHTGPIAQQDAPGTPSGMAYHSDGEFDRDGGSYLRLSWVLADIVPGGGGTALCPGTHRLSYSPPSWIDRDHARVDETGPVGWPAASYELVAPAGSCMINWTTTWHRRTANTAAAPRKLFWQVYRRARQRTSGRAAGLMSKAWVQEMMATQCQARRELIGAGAWRPRWCEYDRGDAVGDGTATVGAPRL